MTRFSKASSPSSASFRDTRGVVFLEEGEVYRALSRQGEYDFDFAVQTGLLDKLVQEEKLVPWEEAEGAGHQYGRVTATKVLRHTPISFISYPYEWTFSALKEAALLHIEIHLRALDHNLTLIDASAYNIQFNGARPIFIDHLSFKPYQEGEFWGGHKQFCEQFLNPLLLHAKLGVGFHQYYRGNLEGIPSEILARLLPWHSYFSLSLLSHVLLPVRFDKKHRSGTPSLEKKVSGSKLSKDSFRNILKHLQQVVEKLNVYGARKTIWSDYTISNSYEEEEERLKIAFISEFSQANPSSVILDIGCNTGLYSQVALSKGAKYCIGLEFDEQALETAFFRARTNDLPFLPLFTDLSNPSPSQGWGQNEREGLQERCKADGILALAILHHLCISKNIPLTNAVHWLMSLAPQGVIEFVPKNDPMVQKLLERKEDTFDDYSLENFEKALEKYAIIVKKQNITKNNRVLIWYKNNEFLR